MTRFGYVMATYFSIMGVAMRVLHPDADPADLERQRQRADRPLRRATAGD